MIKVGHFMISVGQVMSCRAVPIYKMLLFTNLSCTEVYHDCHECQD